MRLPAVVSAGWRTLVIDDQIGSSSTLQKAFIEAVGCAGTSDLFHFFSGQVDGRNRVEQVVEFVREGWPSRDGTRWSLLYLDIRFDQMPQGDDDGSFGFLVLEELRRTFGAELPVVVLTSEADAKRTRANYSLADGFLPKPEQWEANCCQEAHRALRKRLGIYPDESGRCRGASLAYLRILRHLRKLALRGEKNVLLLGETGAGKSWLARFLHRETGRAGPFREAYADPGNFEFEGTRLFGTWSGTWTGAEEGNFPGEAEIAHLGTLFLDEVAELTPGTQAQLLEYRDPLQAPAQLVGWRKVRRRGSYDAGEAWARRQRLARGETWQTHLRLVGTWDPELARVLVDTLLVVATNQTIDDPSVRRRLHFREDLFRAIAQPEVTVSVPPLRDRREEVPELFHELLNSRRQASGRDAAVLDKEAEAALVAHHWPGNFRDLDMTVRTVDDALGDFREVHLGRLPRAIRDPEGSSRAVVLPGSPEEASLARTPMEPLIRVALEPLDPQGLAAAEVGLMGRWVELLRTCFEDAVRMNPHSSPDLKPVMQRLYGIALQPSDSQRELKRLLDPLCGTRGSGAVRQKWQRVPGFRELSDRWRTDPVIRALYDYAARTEKWPAAAARILKALRGSGA